MTKRCYAIHVVRPVPVVVFSERLREPGCTGQHVVQADCRRSRTDGMSAFVGHGVVSLCRQRLERLVHQLFRTSAFTSSKYSVLIGPKKHFNRYQQTATTINVVDDTAYSYARYEIGHKTFELSEVETAIDFIENACIGLSKKDCFEEI